MIFFLCLFIFLPKILAGFIITHLLWKDSDFSAIILKLAIGVPVGMAISASMFFVALLIGIAPKAYSQVEFWSALLLVILFLAQKITLRKGYWKVTELPWQNILATSVVFIGAVLSTSAFLFYSKIHPYGFEDAQSIWNFTARFIYRANSPDIFLNSQFYSRFHPDYPVELSLNVAWGWLFLNNETPRLPISISLLATYIPAVLIWAALIKWRGIISASLGALILLMSVNYPYAITQYADTLIALHMLSAVVLFYGYLKTYQNGLLILAGFLTGSSAWVKNEGLLFVAVFTIVCILAIWKQGIKWRTFKWFVLGSALPLLIVLAYKITVNWQSDLFSVKNSFVKQFLDISRWQIIGQSFVTHIAGYGNWPVSALIILLVYAAVVGIAREETSHQLWLFLVLAGQLAGYFCIYLITPHELSLHIKTSIDRLVIHLYPLIIFWGFVAIRSPNLFISSIKINKNRI